MAWEGEFFILYIGYGTFRECGGTGFIPYPIIFPETGKAVLLMSNIENVREIFQETSENINRGYIAP